MSRPAYLIGHLTAEFCATLLAIAIVIVSGLIVGWGISSTPLEALGGFGMLFLLAIAMIWEYNPVSCWAAAVRTLFGNPTAIPSGAAWPLEHPVVAGLIWWVAILAVVVPVTLRAFRRRTTG